MGNQLCLWRSLGHISVSSLRVFGFIINHNGTFVVFLILSQRGGHCGLDHVPFGHFSYRHPFKHPGAQCCGVLTQQDRDSISTWAPGEGQGARFC